MGMSMFTPNRPVALGRKIDPATVDPATYGTIAVMQPHQITRGLAFRRYAFGKPMAQIADETGLRRDQILSALKGEPMNIAVAARLTGYLRTPCATDLKRRRREDLSVKRRDLMRRLARMRALARSMNLRVGYARIAEIGTFTDDMLIAYLYNAEDAVRDAILDLYPTIAGHCKFSDSMAPWEYLERIDRLKGEPKIRDAIRHSQRLREAEMARRYAKSA